MPSVATFFRHCPSCGRRFEVRLLSKSLVSKERDSYLTTKAGTSSASTFAAQRMNYGNARSPTQEKWDDHVAIEHQVRVTVEEKAFQYAFKCHHCGHQWTEKRAEETQPRVERRRD